ncbi:energy transducer TonB [Desulfoluna sp.]|uniref:energy transducer TonB n=1 Tax=Desulfoluna sp. TaxID=2045199 RepID=UPI002620D37A|nr:energy transducer TonB [Desulfoluna sp.]
MTGARSRGPMATAALLALGVNLFLFALLPGMRTAPRHSEDVLRVRPVTMVRLEEMKPTPPPEAPRKPEKLEAPPKPRLDLPIDPSPAHTAAAPTLKVSPGLPELDTTAFKPSPGDLVFGESQLDRPPMPTHKTAPIYPFRARRLGLAGSVTLKFQVEKDGSVSNMEIVKSTPAGVFDKAVLDAVSRWTYNPGEITGEKVRVRVTKTIHFDLKK